MSTQPLPSNADLGKLRDHAKTTRDWVRAEVSGAIDLVQEHHPRAAKVLADPAAFRLSDAQLTLARMYEFASWPKLVAHVRLVSRYARSPHEQPVGAELTDDVARADELLRLACLNYGSDDPARPVQAAALLTQHPHLARASLHTAAAVGDVAAAAQHLAADPMAAHAQGGPFSWEPLLYLTCSRVEPPGSDALATAQLLLAAGADPNTGYLWDGLVPPMTALTGAFGNGEGNQPPHPAWLALARLLLEAGADANDNQTIYNWGLGSLAGDDIRVLALLLEFGLGQGDGGPWRHLLGDKQPTPAQTMADELAHAARSGLPRRVRLLLDYGADPDSRGGHSAFENRTAYELAVAHGHTEVAALLAQAGADTSGVDPLTRVLGACLSGDAGAVRAISQRDPQLLARAALERPDLLHTAAELGRVSAIRLLVDLGWDVNALHRTTPLHEAALRGDRDTIAVLLELGADPSIKDSEHDSTPASWAEHNGHAEVAAALRVPR